MGIKSSFREASKRWAPPTRAEASPSSLRNACTRHMSVAGSRACTRAVYMTAGRWVLAEPEQPPGPTHHKLIGRPWRVVPTCSTELIHSGYMATRRAISVASSVELRGETAYQRGGGSHRAKSC